MPLPNWVKSHLKDIKKTQNYLKARKLNTVCETLRCPNRTLCYSKPTATFMILGNICTRGCKFCNAEFSIPEPVDLEEPKRIAEAVRELSLRYVVITSPTRDDLPDGGAQHFVNTVFKIKRENPRTLIEVLVPDFSGNRDSVEAVVNSEIAVFAHNIETVKRFYNTVRKGDYERSLSLIKWAKQIRKDIFIKSGFMVGLGETYEEILETLRDLRDASCDIVTIGQYLQPSKKALPVVEYIKPEVFNEIALLAKEIGFKAVLSGPLIRSSTQAYEIYISLKGG